MGGKVFESWLDERLIVGVMGRDTRTAEWKSGSPSRLSTATMQAADVCVLYDSEENVIRDTDTIYHKQ